MAYVGYSFLTRNSPCSYVMKRILYTITILKVLLWYMSLSKLEIATTNTGALSGSLDRNIKKY